MEGLSPEDLRSVEESTQQVQSLVWQNAHKLVSLRINPAKEVIPSPEPGIELINNYHAYCLPCLRHIFSQAFPEDVPSLFAEHLNCRKHRALILKYPKSNTVLAKSQPVFCWVCREIVFPQTFQRQSLYDEIAAHAVSAEHRNNSFIWFDPEMSLLAAVSYTKPFLAFIAEKYCSMCFVSVEMPYGPEEHAVSFSHLLTLAKYLKQCFGLSIEELLNKDAVQYLMIEMHKWRRSEVTGEDFEFSLFQRPGPPIEYMPYIQIGPAEENVPSEVAKKDELVEDPTFNGQLTNVIGILENMLAKVKGAKLTEETAMSTNEHAKATPFEGFAAENKLKPVPITLNRSQNPVSQPKETPETPPKVDKAAAKPTKQTQNEIPIPINGENAASSKEKEIFLKNMQEDTWKRLHDAHPSTVQFAMADGEVAIIWETVVAILWSKDKQEHVEATEKCLQIINDYHAYCNACCFHIYSRSCDRDVPSLFSSHINMAAHKDKAVFFPRDQLMFTKTGEDSGRCHSCCVNLMTLAVQEKGLAFEIVNHVLSTNHGATVSHQNQNALLIRLATNHHCQLLMQRLSNQYVKCRLCEQTFTIVAQLNHLESKEHLDNLSLYLRNNFAIAELEGNPEKLAQLWLDVSQQLPVDDTRLVEILPQIKLLSPKPLPKNPIVSQQATSNESNEARQVVEENEAVTAPIVPLMTSSKPPQSQSAFNRDETAEVLDLSGDTGNEKSDAKFIPTGVWIEQYVGCGPGKGHLPYYSHHQLQKRDENSRTLTNLRIAHLPVFVDILTSNHAFCLACSVHIATRSSSMVGSISAHLNSPDHIKREVCASSLEQILFPQGKQIYCLPCNLKVDKDPARQEGVSFKQLIAKHVNLPGHKKNCLLTAHFLHTWIRKKAAIYRNIKPESENIINDMVIQGDQELMRISQEFSRNAAEIAEARPSNQQEDAAGISSAAATQSSNAVTHQMHPSMDAHRKTSKAVKKLQNLFSRSKIDIVNGCHAFCTQCDFHIFQPNGDELESNFGTHINSGSHKMMLNIRQHLGPILNRVDRNTAFCEPCGINISRDKVGPTTLLELISTHLKTRHV